MTDFGVTITADGVVGDDTPEPEGKLRLASEWDLKDGDLIEVRYGDDDESELAQYADHALVGCIYFFGTSFTATPDKVYVVRKVKLVDAE